MAEIRQGYLDDYTQITSGNIGIGTSAANEKLEIIGGTTSQELDVTGISTFSHVSGFIKKHTDYTGDIDFDAGDSGTLSGEIVVGVGLTMTVGTGATVSQGSVDSLKVSNMFQPPSGTTNQRPPAKPGALFYNFDFKTIEFFDGNSWRQVDNTTTRGRAIVAGGNTPSGGAYGNRIDFVEIHSSGNSQAFGELTLHSSRHTVATSNSIRGLVKHGYTPSAGSDNDIEYLTIASGGNGIDFGDATYSAWGNAFVSSSTRGVLGGGVGAVNTMCYVQIMTIGAALDFGDLSVAMRHTAGYASPTRGIIGTGDDGTSPGVNISNFDSFTIASTGNATDFGDASFAARAVSSCSNTTRGLWMGGYFNTPRSGGSVQKQVSSTTIASGGQASDFGNLITGKSHSRSTCSQTRAIDFGGQNPSGLKRIETLEFASGGSAQFFGEMQENTQSCGALSDCHGGLGGF